MAMEARLLGFIVGAVSAFFWPALPPIWFCIITAFIAFVCLIRRKRPLLGGFLIGILWLASVGHWQSRWQLPHTDINQNVIVDAVVENIQTENSDPMLTLRLVSYASNLIWQQPLVRVRWYKAPIMLQQGDRLQLTVRMKPPHGLANRHAFHYQQWLFTQGIRATGYVVAGDDNRLIARGPTQRQRLVNFFQQQGYENHGWLAALSLGYRGWLDQQDWSLMQASGLAHLIAISGLHLGMVALFGYALLSRVLVWCGSQRFNLHYVSVSLSVAIVAVYAYLAGFSTPTVRALIAISVLTLSLLRARFHSGGSLLLRVVALIILVAPLSIFSLSLWLSLSAVLILLGINWRLPVQQRKGPWQLIYAIRLQLVLCLLMLPVIASQFGLISLVSPLLNLIAVPLVTLILLPACLLGLILLFIVPEIAAVWFGLLDRIFGFLLSGLELAVNSEWAAIDVGQVSVGAWVTLAIAAIVAFLPVFYCRHRLTILLIIPALLYFWPVQRKTWSLSVMDIGQGLSVVIVRNGHALIYDTAALYPSGFAPAQAALVPYLRAQGVKEIDYVFISHTDNDHAGGLATLQQEFRVHQVLTNQDRCNQSLDLDWQGLNVVGMAPPKPVNARLAGENPYSCVIMLNDGQHRILLPGDIDAVTEKALIARLGSDLRADIVLVPHHGSSTSSTQAFVDFVKPRHAVVSAGKLNRWKHPRLEVLRRYQVAGAEIWRTDDHGQITFTFDADGYRIDRYRQDDYPFWYANFR